MRIYLKISFLLLLPVFSICQQTNVDSLKKIFLGTRNDSVLYQSAINLYDFYEELNRDSAFFYADQCVQISRKNNKKLNEAYSLTRKAYQELNLGRYAKSLNSLLDAFSIAENETNDKYFWAVDPLTIEHGQRLYALACAHHIYAILMRETLNREQQLIHFKEAKKIAVAINSPIRSLLASLNLGRVYLEADKLDSAEFYETEAETIATNFRREKYLSSILYHAGMVNMKKGDTAVALACFYRCIQSGNRQNNMDGATRGYHRLAEFYLDKKNKDSSLYYALESLEAMRKLGNISQIEYNIGDAYEGVYKAFELNGKFDSSYKYLQLARESSDSINNLRIQNLAEFQKLSLNEQRRLQNIEKEKAAYQNRIRTYFLLSGIGVFLLLAIIFYRNNKQKHRAKIKIEQAYNHLKETQQQLIQSEKMASLGELTAGIAHEIQNPLNFVNNFAEVNTELVEELKEEVEKGNLDEAKSIADDLKDNNQKIAFHGKRADSIVKGMLQHSRTSTGKKEPTDINALADEFLRLSYHGLRAKDKSFNASMETNFDYSIKKIEIIPQDLGRVLLNLFNNAFYSVNEKKRALNGLYEPKVSLSTKKLDGKVQIIVSDNGNGIPQKLLDKIYQPFFTTKPTGEGTGLGLSLSYDIITKGHGGELKVETKEGEFALFKIILPLSDKI